MIAVDINAIPHELASRQQWVLWKSIVRDGRETKLPFQVDGSAAKSNDPTTWNSLESCLENVANYSGVGYVFSVDDPMVGIDLDGCRNPDSGELAKWAQTLVDDFDSYAEVSPSGTGVKLFIQGDWPRTGKNKKLEGVERVSAKEPGIEVYGKLRYFAVTGQRLQTSPNVQHRQEQLDKLYAEHFERKPAINRSHSHGLNGSASKVERARAYIATMPPGISGQGGHNATFAAACALVRFDLSRESAIELLREFNERCEPPWRENELEHKVDSAFQKAASERGDLLNADRFNGSQVDISGIATVKVAKKRTGREGGSNTKDPGPLKTELLSVPGFVDDVMQFTLSTAPHPNRVLAFAGAMALMATLVGRKVSEPGNLRTNLQILALAGSGVGKDWSRKVNARILLECGQAFKLGGKSASGEGIEDRLVGHPVLLKQDDEIDALYANMGDNMEARYRNQMTMFLELFSEAGAWRSVRDKANKDFQIIHQPHLVLFGTTTPRSFYDSMSAKMLTKGLVARHTILEAGPRSKRQKSRWPSLPEAITSVAQWWCDFVPSGWGNLSEGSGADAPPLVVELTADAERVVDRFADEADSHYEAAESNSDEPVMAIWARALERSLQLALTYACSKNHEAPEIDRDAIEWATSLVRHTILRTLYMLSQHFHESHFEANCNAMYEKLQAWTAKEGPEVWMPHRVLRKRLKRLDARQFEEAWKTNVEMERIEVVQESTGGRPTLNYRILTDSG